AGGIAHDFNNLLGIIIANLDMLEEDIGDDRRLARPVKTALKAALRSADLTKRLSAFSRQSESKAKPVNLNEVIKGLDDLLARSLTAEIEIRTVLDDALWLTEISEGDFEDVVLNLALNGRDAMPEGGCLVIETTNTELEPTDDEAVDYGGQYVMFAISDNGCGMTEESREKIFDRFFTTKEVGEGSGLGLSMVYGFVARSRGRIQVESEPDQGTTIRIYLPRAQGSKKKSGTKQSRDKSLPRGSETLLIVDDEPDLLAATRESLQTLGYRVMVAENANEALRLLENNPDIDMLFTDVVMPGGMNGLELASDAMKQKPGLKVLVTTGFSKKIQRQDGYSRLLDSHLPKPYRRIDLARRIREVLDSGSTISSASK
ncbi:MAG: response regulator, partial [Alphaproteobacteria bacterium]|nr:response regulator [Alphaproteobacteria bacterium]